MRKGPAPKPTKLRILSGNAAKRPLNRNEPQPKLAKRPRSPVDLDEHGQKFWHHYAPKLKRLCLLSEIDLHLLAMGAQWWSVYKRAMEDLRNAIIQTTEANGNCARPEVAIAKQAFNAVRSILAEFGVGPGSRTKVAALSFDKPDDFDSFKNKRPGARRFLA